MTPEDRVSYTMELQEDVAAKVEIVKKAIATESELLPQGKLILVKIQPLTTKAR